MITTVLFDLGNVTFKIDFDLCLRFWAEKTGTTFDTLKQNFSFDEVYGRHERGELSVEEYHQYLCKKFNFKLMFQDFLTGWNGIYGSEIEETLAFLKEAQDKINLYAFTNSNKTHREFWSKKYAVTLQLFKKTFCSSQMSLRKPDPAAYQFILNELKIKPSELVFIDDTLENIQGATSLGIKSIHFGDADPSIRQLRQLVLG